MSTDIWGDIELEQIGKVGDSRCRKRDSFLSILSAIDFVEKHFIISMEKPDVICRYSFGNNQCIGKRAFHKSEPPKL